MNNVFYGSQFIVFVEDVDASILVDIMSFITSQPSLIFGFVFGFITLISSRFLDRRSGVTEHEFPFGYYVALGIPWTIISLVFLGSDQEPAILYAQILFGVGALSVYFSLVLFINTVSLFNPAIKTAYTSVVIAYRLIIRDFEYLYYFKYIYSFQDHDYYNIFEDLYSSGIINLIRKFFPGLVRQFIFESLRNNNHYKELLAKKIKQWALFPQTDQEKLDYWEGLRDWDSLVRMGHIAVPVLIKNRRIDELVFMGNIAVPELTLVWKEWRDGCDECYAAKVLCKLNLPPFDLYERMLSFANTWEWYKLDIIGEPAVPILIEYDRWNQLVQMGQIAVPGLIAAWDNLVRKGEIMLSELIRNTDRREIRFDDVLSVLNRTAHELHRLGDKRGNWVYKLIYDTEKIKVVDSPEEGHEEQMLNSYYEIIGLEWVIDKEEESHYENLIIKWEKIQRSDAAYNQ